MPKPMAIIIYNFWYYYEFDGSRKTEDRIFLLPAPDFCLPTPDSLLNVETNFFV